MLTDSLVSVILYSLLLIETETVDPDCCQEPSHCKHPDCSCCSEERYNICQTRGKTSCGGDCKPGYHGEFCYNKCPDHCLTCKDWVESYSRECLTCETGYHVAYRRCVPDDCPDTCISCVNSSHCTDCSLGHYNGQEAATLDKYTDCRLKCPVRCTSCTSHTNCLSCRNGYYGAQCPNVCSNGCHVGFCHNDGSCNCRQNYIGKYCEIHVLSGQQQCSFNCNNNACNTSTGKCLNGCLGNFQEPFCTFCLPNFYSETCEFCIPGKYGTNCIEECPDNCAKCDQETGHCEVCWGNFEGNKCDICKPGFYGERCNYVCSSNCVDKLCIRSNGTCSKGCIPPYSGDRCCLNQSNCKTCSSNSECSHCVPGRFGATCENECISNCVVCNKGNGTCLKCKGNYWEKAQPRRSSSPNTIIAGVCGTAAVLIVAALIVGSIIFIKRKRDRVENNPYHNQPMGTWGFHIHKFFGQTSEVDPKVKLQKKKNKLSGKLRKMDIQRKKMENDLEIIEKQLEDTMKMSSLGQEDRTYEQLGYEGEDESNYTSINTL